MSRAVRIFLGSVGAGIVVFFLLYFFAPPLTTVRYSAGEAVKTLAQEVQKVSQAPQIPAHIDTPAAVKAIYMSSCVVGTQKFRDEVVHVVDTTEINSLVIDIKDYSGTISFTPADPALADVVSDKCGTTDMKGFIDTLHDKGIYVIGRITVFQDPYMSKKYPERAVQSRSTGGPWKDHKGLSFIDVGSRQHWDYIVALSKAAYDVGFDELNYDYIRYPSDGNMSDTHYALPEGKTKPEMLKEFFSYLHDHVKPFGVKMSADLFGMTMTNKDDLNIGQVLENALPYFDYIAPMVYPSHYPPGFHNFDNPNKHVYEVIQFSMETGVKRVKEFYNLLPPPPPPTVGTSTATSTPPQVSSWVAPAPEKVSELVNKLRPWLQDFDYGGNYDIPEVKAQIKATYDVGLTSWMLWAPSNRYTVGALLPQ